MSDTPMLNDAAKLAEVMRDVPREAWPPDLEYQGRISGWDHKNFRAKPTAITAELACIGSMTAWLVECDATFSKVGDDYGVRVPALFAGPRGALQGSEWYRAPTLTEALAAACRGIKENTDDVA